MAATFYIKQNDTAPSLEVVLTDSTGRARSLTDATVKFHMSAENGTVIVSGGTCGVVGDKSKGRVIYPWQSGDTENVGVHKAEFEVTYGDGQKETFPNSSYIKVIVTEELA